MFSCEYKTLFIIESFTRSRELYIVFLDSKDSWYYLSVPRGSGGSAKLILKSLGLIKAKLARKSSNQCFGKRER